MKNHLDIMIYSGDKNLTSIKEAVQKHYDRFNRLPAKIFLPKELYAWYDDQMHLSSSVRRVLKFNGITVLEL